ncbi:c-type cytochrome [Marinobacter subterrani]|uniref:Cytochrome C oxidase, cbb3-type, subunit III n=1 Tax=Marinobacter subterrani TaxID=1658765 RepID=A0A0J7LZU6_9GAMM|nr:cytochrome c [Marinobacter subterrani]KMQ74415.1 Cytochrome C oxidase, cbb3-type, subunit III [Marinobacter subterrani]
MFSFHKSPRLIVSTCCGVFLASIPFFAAADQAGHYGYGEPATDKQIAAWDIDVRPDGMGLPEGSGTVDEGMAIFETQCSSCHGSFGEGMGRYPKLAGGEGSLTEDRPEKTVGSFWPYASTLWDYIHRAMPFFAPQSLTDDQVYALTAYVLNLNYIVDGDFVANKETLPKVVMPNQGNFTWEDPRPDVNNERCMKDCKEEATVSDSAAGKNLTPSTTGPLDEGITQ